MYKAPDKPTKLDRNNKAAKTVAKNLTSFKKKVSERLKQREKHNLKPKETEYHDHIKFINHLIKQLSLHV